MAGFILEAPLQPDQISPQSQSPSPFSPLDAFGGEITLANLTREIRRRIKSVKNIAQVTKAMEAVSAAKMRKAQQQVLATRPYAKQAREVLTYIARLTSTESELNPLMRPRPVKRVGILLVTADRGLAGGFNANVIRAAAHNLMRDKRKGARSEVVAVGKKGRDWLLRYDPGHARRVHGHSRQPDR
jgi:ATP synthase F1 gamma subunit